MAKNMLSWTETKEPKKKNYAESDTIQTEFVESDDDDEIF